MEILSCFHSNVRVCVNMFLAGYVCCNGEKNNTKQIINKWIDKQNWTSSSLDSDSFILLLFLCKQYEPKIFQLSSKDKELNVKCNDLFQRWCQQVIVMIIMVPKQKRKLCGKSAFSPWLVCMKVSLWGAKQGRGISML